MWQQQEHLAQDVIDAIKSLSTSIKAAMHINHTVHPNKVWFGLLLFNGSFRTNRLYRAIGV